MNHKLFIVALVVFAQPALAAEFPYHWMKSGNKADFITGGHWFNCGPTGIRAAIPEARPTEFLVKYVFEGSPATKKIFKDDRIIGANGKVWKQKERHPKTPGNWEGGYEGPRLQLGMAIEESEGGDGTLSLIVMRKDEMITVDIRLKPIGRFSKSFPVNCEKTQTLVKDAAIFLNGDRRWMRGQTYTRHMVILGLLAQGGGCTKLAEEYLRGVEFKSDYSQDELRGWAWNAALEGIMLAELYLATKDRRILPRLKYLNRWYANGAVENGAFCHKFGQSGYGTMTPPTAMVAAAWALFKRCGVQIDEKGYMRARWILDLVTQPSGGFPYSTRPDKNPNPEKGVWVEGEAGKSRRFAATGYAAAYHHIDPVEIYSKKYVRRAAEAAAHSKAIFPDGHASSSLNLFGGFLAAAIGPKVQRGKAYREVLDFYKYWLNVNRCHDGSFYNPPSRDRANADGGHDTRYGPTGAVLVLLSGPNSNLEMLRGAGSVRVSSEQPSPAEGATKKKERPSVYLTPELLLKRQRPQKNKRRVGAGIN